MTALRFSIIFFLSTKLPRKHRWTRAHGFAVVPTLGRSESHEKTRVVVFSQQQTTVSLFILFFVRPLTHIIYEQ